MSTLDTLRREYPGDDAWAAYAAVYKPAAANGDTDAVRALIPQDRELAETLVGVFGDAGAVAWIDGKIGALDGLSPAEVIGSQADGCRIVRHALMRMPV